MNKKALNKLELLPFFTSANLLTLEKLSPNTLNQNLKRWVKNGDMIRLKNGLYVTKTFVDRATHSAGYVEFLANRLLSPSYLSLEYVLQKHNLLTEATFSITSITPKSTRRYVNSLGTFQYRTIAPQFYFGFKEERFGKNIIFEASLAKALFDYLYYRLSELDLNDPSAIEELRLNWNEISASDLEEFSQIIERSGIDKMKLVLTRIKSRR